MDLSFNTLRKANMLRQKEWDPEKKATRDFHLIELVGEIGEMFNVVKKIMRLEYGIRGSRATQDDLESEFADAQICLDLAAQKCGVDLGKAVEKKFNETSTKYDLVTRIKNGEVI